MDTSGSELQELRRLVGELTARVFRLEQRVEPAAGSCRRGATAPCTHASTATCAGTKACPAGDAVHPASAACESRPAKQSSADLESRIGSHWLNRIGITAVLIGVSYFLKFAFDNNWIGPAGRVAIGLLAGIAIVVWSENFRRRGYLIFSYSLKAVGIGVLYLSLVRGLPGVQPGDRRRGFQHDVCGDGCDRGDGLDPGRGNPGGLRPDRRIRYASAALHRPES